MDISDAKYNEIKNSIMKEYRKYKKWDDVRKLKIYEPYPIDFAMKVSMFGSTNGLDHLTVPIWNQLIENQKKLRDSTQVIKMDDGVKSEAKISNDSLSAWQLYRKRLEEKGFSNKSIYSIEKSSIEVLRSMSMDNIQRDELPIKGLVVGDVQSGKTANMAGLMAMAADIGFNYFIILSGVIESLRQQTSARLYQDMTYSGKGNLHWNQVDKPSIGSQKVGQNISNFNLGEGDKDRYFTVTLKNSSRLEKLYRWLIQDKNKAKQLKILIIDDEADQASVNTKKIEEEDSTRINELIRKIVDYKGFKAMNYIAYTATPFANILNDTDESSLYPKDFITLLEPSEDYIGPQEIFGLTEPDTRPKIPIYRRINGVDRDIVRDIQKGTVSSYLPESFVNSIHWFLLTVAAMRVLNYKKPISMLVHTSFKTQAHQIIADKISEYLLYLRKNFNQILPSIKELYLNEKEEFSRDAFLNEMKDYSSKEKVPDYPSWQLVEEQLIKILTLPEMDYVSNIPIGELGEPIYHRGIHIAIDNSRAVANDQIIRLVYPECEQKVAPAFIVVGGNTLSRGLTLEGLTTTYFLRTTDQADTLMQMGRWFGFRKGYEIFPRVWLDHASYERFIFLSQMDEELKEEIRDFSERGQTPSDYAPAVKYSPDRALIRVTANNKMQSARPIEFDFTGFNSQTTYFENDEEILMHNQDETKKFLNSLNSPQVNSKYMIWRDVDIDSVKNFLQEYSVYPNASKMASLPALLEWAEENKVAIDKWSVVLVSKGKVKETKIQDAHEATYWNIQGYSPRSITRSKLIDIRDGEVAAIGVLRSPSDLISDIDKDLPEKEKKDVTIKTIKNLREIHGYGTVPQLLIYKIDKNSTPSSHKTDNDVSSQRSPLNFKEDIIGINIMLPGKVINGTHVKKISAKLKIKEDINIQDEFEEDED